MSANEFGLLETDVQRMRESWRNTPVEHRLILGFGLFLVLLVTVSLVALERMSQMNDVTSQIVTGPLPALSSLGRFNTDARVYRTSDYRYLLTFKTAEKPKVLARFEDAQRDADMALADYRLTVTDREDRKHFDELLTRWQRYKLSHDALLPIMTANDIPVSADVLNGSMRADFLALEDQIDEMMTWNRLQGLGLAVQARSAFDVSRLLVFGLFLAAVLAGGIASWIVIRNVRQLIVNIQARQTAQEALRQRDQLYKAIVANASDVILIIAANGAIAYASPSADDQWGISGDSLIGSDVLSIVHPEDKLLARALFGLAEDEPATNQAGEVRVQRPDGRWRTCEVIVNDQSGEPAVGGMVATCRDITERKVFEEQLAHQAVHDKLSGLPNRALFLDRLERAILRSGLQDKMVAVILLDLDNFKVVNESIGHDAGDEMLVEVATRLNNCLRPEDTVARLGGDEFAILLEDVSDPAEACEAADRVSRALRSPLAIKGREVFTTASIGVAISSQKQDLPGDMLRYADTAMYQAKATGKAHHIIFDRTMNERATERLELESDLRRAIDTGELCLHYQPVIELETGEVNEVEALVRWQHPIRGLMPPLKFIPLAEETGLILPLGRWVLSEACRRTVEWQQLCPDKSLTVSVNISARQFSQADMVSQIAGVLSETGLAASSLKLEITESLMMVNPEDTRAKLTQLKELGVRVAIDDFGTGYSSMAYLSLFPLDTIKIDQSFVGGLGRQAEADAIVRAIVTLAKTLNLEVTSEGIETADQLARLSKLGSDRGQGFFFSRPLPDAGITNLLTGSQRQVPAFTQRAA